MAMADNMIFPIQFDLEKGVNDAIKDWDGKYADKLEKAIQKRALNVKLKFDTKAFDNLDDVKRRLAELKITPLTPENKTAIRELVRELKELARIMEKIQKFKGIELPELQMAKAAKLRNDVEQANEKMRLSQERVRQSEERLILSQQRAAQQAKNTGKAFGEQESYLNNLIKKMAVYASISYVGNFLTSIREVTAQFELQRVSLGAILQDANKGEQIFSQIKQFALSSPLSILDLTKYTKQLAAYKIEYDELFDMTKRLADISVGIGADFQRIVLAAGQTRTATYLRASELRQFTELGVPLLEELSVKLSKMNGEMVTTAEVMDLISQRAISWELVKEVLYDMTDAGGMFYQMQEKQGNTLYGLWQKLGDAAAVMYEEIGNTGIINSEMKEGIQILTELMRNWKAVGLTAATTILPAVAAMAAWKMATKALAKSVTTATSERIVAETKLATAMKGTDVAAQNAARSSLAKAKADEAAAIAAQKNATAQGKLKMGFVSLGKTIASGLGIGIAVMLVTKLIYKFYEALTNFRKLKRELGSIYTETATLQDQSVRNFEFLADKAVKAASGSKEQTDALQELNRTYRDILPQEALTIENLTKMKGKYDALTQSIREHIAEQQRQKAESAIMEYYGTKIRDAQMDVRERLYDQGLSATEVGRFFAEFEKIAPEYGSDVWAAFRDAMIAAGVKDKKRIAQIWKKEFELSQRDIVSGDTGRANIRALSEAYADQANELKGMNEQYRESIGNLGKFAGMQKRVSNAVANAIYIFKGGAPVNRDTQGDILDAMKLNLWVQKTASEIQNNEDIKKAFAYMGEGIKSEWFNIINVINSNDLGKVSQINFDAIIASVDNMIAKLGNKNPEILAILNTFRNYLVAQKEEYENMVPSKAVVVRWQTTWRQIVKELKISRQNMNRYLMGSAEDFETYRKRIKDEVATVIKTIALLQDAITKNKKTGKRTKEQQAADEKELQQAKERKVALEKLLAELDKIEIETGEKEEGSTGSKSDTRLQVLQEVAQTLATINKEYDDLAKKEGASKALADIKERFEEVLAYTNKLGGKFGLNFGLPTEFKTLQEYRNAILKVMQSLKGLPEGSEKTILDFKTMIGKADSDYLQKQIEKQLKELADRISRTKTAKEFYEKILRLTRNEDLAFRATFSVFGQDKLDTFTDEVEQLKQNFGEIDITAAINLNTKQIDYKALREIWEADKALPDNLRKIPQAYDSAIKSILDAGDKLSERQFERWGKDLERARDYADKRIELAEYTATQIAEIGAKRDSLKPDSEGYEQQRAMYDEMLRGYREREKNEAAKLDYEQIKEQIGMFDDLGVRIGTAFESILNGLREYTQSPDFARLGLEAQKNVYQQIAKIEDRMAEGFQGIGIGTVSEYVRQYSTAASEYLTAQNNLREATLKAIEADKEWERVKNNNDEAAKSAALAEKTLADSRVRTAAASVNAAGANLQRAQEGAARASAKFDSNLQKVESSLKSLNNGALKALWGLIGDKGKRSVGEFLSGSRKILSALDKLTKALAESGSDMGQLSTTIATNLATALQNINPDDTEAIAKAATESLKTTLSSVISDKGVVELLANTLSKNLGEIASQALSGVLSTEDAANKVGALIDGVADAASKTGEMWGAIISLVLSLLDEFAENGIGTFLGELLDNVADAVEGILANLLTDSLPKILGSVGNVVKGVGVGLADMLTFGVFDLTGAKRIKKANKEIERQQEILDRLEYTYSRLEKAAASLFGADYISNYNAQMKNLQAQQTAYLRMAEAERSKGKDADDAKIAEYTNAARDAADKIQDMRNELTSKFLGTDRASAAREFAESWLEAKATFASTTDAIQSKYKDMLKSMIVEGAAAKVIDNILAPMWDNMNAMLKKSNIQGAMDYLASNMDGFLQAADSGLNALWATLEARGYDMQKLLGETSDGPTGIAHDIATASEESINGLAAGINTQNFYIAQQLQEVQRIRAIVEAGLQGSSKPSDSSNLLLMQEQAMNHYAAIEANTAATVARLDSVVRMLEGVITPRGTKGARGIQVWT